MRPGQLLLQVGNLLAACFFFTAGVALFFLPSFPRLSFFLERLFGMVQENHALWGALLAFAAIAIIYCGLSATHKETWHIQMGVDVETACLQQALEQLLKPYIVKKSRVDVYILHGALTIAAQLPALDWDQRIKILQEVDKKMTALLRTMGYKRPFRFLPSFR